MLTGQTYPYLRRVLPPRSTPRQRSYSRLRTSSLVPVVAMNSQRLRELNLDHRAGYLMSLLDGELTVSDVFDVSDIPNAEVSDLLSELVERGAVTFLVRSN